MMPNDRPKAGSKLNRKQSQAIAALLANSSIPEAARACGIGEATLWRWLQLPEFAAQYRQAQRAIVDSAIGELQAATVAAVKTLRRNLSCGNFFAENTAAQAILGQSLKAIEIEELQERIEKLEVLLQAQGKGKRWA